MSNNLSFIHRFAPGKRRGAPPLLLLHGTGGDENDLLQLGEMVSPGSALLSPRGKVLEHGMPRFFRRLAEGVFDEDDVRRRANELVDFVEFRTRTLWPPHAGRAGLFQRREYRGCNIALEAAGVCRRDSAAAHGAPRPAAKAGPHEQAGADLVGPARSYHPSKQFIRARSSTLARWCKRSTFRAAYRPRTYSNGRNACKGVDEDCQASGGRHVE